MREDPRRVIPYLGAVMPEARLVEVHREPGGLYEAVLAVEYGGRDYLVKMCRLLRPPARASPAEIRDGYLVIELFDEQGAPVATCCIHLGHLERGCMKCPSLVAPPRVAPA